MSFWLFKSKDVAKSPGRVALSSAGYHKPEREEENRDNKNQQI